ncbi:YjfB family protein [Paenibacillus rigui]|uniref:Putative motility protein n=1 Tax=Paenibacillus rigui TaxID=554312 RepID=A0A229UY21_9BACL|nr:YjfB family protein [Paenibacillus rigui]OXM88387.1 putative motility protein [Paenibacillus rigui]
MDSVSSLLSAAGGSVGLQQAVNVSLLKKTMDGQESQVNALLQGFAEASHPYLGKSLDIKI